MVIIEEVPPTPDRRSRGEGSGRDALVLKTFGNSSRTRMSADPSLSVADIHGALNSFVESCSMDGPGLLKALTPPTGVSWKSATPIAWILKLEALLTGLLAKVPSGVLTSRKSKEAFRRMDENYPFFVKSQKKAAEHHLQDTVDTLDDSLRMLLAHVRDLKLSKTAFERVTRRASSDELERIQKLLNMIVLSSSDSRIRQDSFGGGSPMATSSKSSPKKAKATSVDAAVVGTGGSMPALLLS